MKSIKITPSTPQNIDVEQISANRAMISAYPFEKGYGITLAHPIKRLLLSSSVGYAITGIRINGVSHEFDSIRGMSEDVSLFIINLRKLQFKIADENETNLVVNYTFEGEKILLGSDLKTQKLDVLNPDTYLATLNEDTKIEFSIIVNKGIGYVTSEDIRGTILDSFIPVDAYFTPVKKVVYDIENVLVKDDPTFEKVIFDIETDGRISAIEAFKNAISTMNRQMEIFNKELKIESNLQSNDSNEASEHKILFSKLDALNLGARCSNCLDKKGLNYVGELVILKESELKAINNLGKRSYDEIVEKLGEIGYKVGANLPSHIKEKILKLKNKDSK